MENSKRTVTCGELRKSDVGKKVVLNGWVARTRDLGGLLFIRLRDRYGITQVMVGDKASDDVKKIAASLKSEYCIAVEGIVAARSDKDVNADMATGEIEVEATDIEIFTTSQELPFSIEEVRQKDGTLVVANEDLRLKYRYLDLRREPMQHNIILRSQVAFATREYLTSKGFLEIETPTFIKSTGGFISKYLGDGIISIFPEKNDSVCRCAVEIQRKFESMGPEFERYNIPMINIGIGIHCGKVAVGFMGNEKHIDAVACAESIVQAVEIEGLNKKFDSNILISERALNYCRTFIDCLYEGVMGEVRGEKTLLYKVIHNSGFAYNAESANVKGGEG